MRAPIQGTVYHATVCCVFLRRHFVIQGAINRGFGVPTHDFLWIKPWLNRWRQEEIEPFEDRELAIRSFQRGKEAIAGATGIHTQALLDMKNKKVLWFYIVIAPPEGVVVERKFI